MTRLTQCQFPLSHKQYTYLNYFQDSEVMS